MARDFESYMLCGLALDPIHVGTGACRLGRVDSPIVRDPVTQIPKIPGSSLAGVLRTYVAMRQENEHPGRKTKEGKDKPYYPDCAGQGQPKFDDTGVYSGGHCGRADCPVCTVFGFATGRDSSGGFAGLAGFSDLHVLLFPVPTLQGPVWVTSPLTLRQSGIPGFEKVADDLDPTAIYLQAAGEAKRLNLGWLYLPVKDDWQGWNEITPKLNTLAVDPFITGSLALVSDKLFGHVVNANLEVRTSVAIDPATGAAETGALFTYEALPRGTELVGELTCKNPSNYKINNESITAIKTAEDVRGIVSKGAPYLEHLGIGGMGSRGMGRLRLHVAETPNATEAEKQ